MKKLYFFLCMAVLLVMAACSPAPTPEPTATAAPAPTESPTAAPAVDECVVCHTDKQQLIDTTKVEETGGESESSGVG